MSDGIPEKPKARRDVKPAVILSDSELLVRQMNGVYRVRDPELIELNRKAKELIARLGGIKIIHIPRSQNRTADSIVNRVLNDHF
jgi:ribonuclease HI